MRRSAIPPLLLSLSLHLAAALPAQASGDVPSVRALLQEAAGLARRGEHAAATERLVAALEIAPNSEDVLATYAKVSLAARAAAPAIKALEPLVRMHPTVAEYPYLLGVARMQIGEMDASVEALERSLEIEPGQALPLIALGMAFNIQKRFDRSKAAARQSLRRMPDNVEALAVLAEAEEGLGELDDAARHAERALEQAETHQGAELVLGKVRMSQGRYEEARDAFRRAVEADPTSSKAHYQLSLAYARLKDSENSKKHLELYHQAHREAQKRLAEERTQAGLEDGETEP